MSDRPRLLPLLGATRHGSRDAMTCLYRCGNACDHPVPNTSDNPYLGDIVDAEVSRRGVVRAGAVGALVLGFGGAAAGAERAARVGELDEEMVYESRVGDVFLLGSSSWR
ncbi:hypothetical protein ACFPZ4_29225, partial [Micromonospora harpali]